MDTSRLVGKWVLATLLVVLVMGWTLTSYGEPPSQSQPVLIAGFWSDLLQSLTEDTGSTTTQFGNSNDATNGPCLHQCHARCEVDHDKPYNQQRCKDRCFSACDNSSSGGGFSTASPSNNRQASYCLRGCQDDCTTKHATQRNRERCNSGCYSQCGLGYSGARNDYQCASSCKKRCREKHAKAQNRERCQRDCVDGCY